MPSKLELLITGATASVLTLFDLDRVFYVPSKTKKKVALRCWWWAFIVLNAAIACLLLLAVGGIAPFKDMQWTFRGFVAGLSYLAIIRAKVTTFSFQGRDVPFGPEALYEAAKQFVYKRINKIAMDSRYEEAIALQNSFL